MNQAQVIGWLLLSVVVGCGKTRQLEVPSGQPIAASDNDPTVPVSPPQKQQDVAPQVAGQSTEPSVAAAPGNSRISEPSVATTTATTAQRNNNAPQPPPSTAKSLQIKQSAGVALAQSLPSGTAMGFSVDYKIEQGTPQAAYKYLWIIQAANALQPFGREIPLQQRGTLQTFVPQWKPRHGPFESVIVEVSPDGTRRAITKAVPLEAT